MRISFVNDTKKSELEFLTNDLVHETENGKVLTGKVYVGEVGVGDSLLTNELAGLYCVEVQKIEKSGVGVDSAVAGDMITLYYGN